MQLENILTIDFLIMRIKYVVQLTHLPRSKSCTTFACEYLLIYRIVVGFNFCVS